MPHRPSKPRAANRCARAIRTLRAPAAAIAGLLAVLIAASPAHADICKYLDPDGNIHYSNLPPEKAWKRISCSLGDNSPSTGNGVQGSPRVAPAVSNTNARANPTPPGFPKVDTQTQRSRDDVRRRVLAEELSTEQKLLAEARVAYADGAPPPQPDERADAEKYRARIGKLRQALNVHEKNVEALKKELAAVK